VIGTRGRALLEKDAVSLSAAGGNDEKITCSGDKDAAQIKYFLDCVRTGAEPSPSLEESLAATRLIECAKQSMREKKRIWTQNCG